MSWIWLNKEKYPQYQKNFSSLNEYNREERLAFPYCVAQFRKEYRYDKVIRTAEITVSADCFFHLFANGNFVGIGPASSGGDFLLKVPAPKHYSNTYTVDIDSYELTFDSWVRLHPEKLTDFSRYQGGFMLNAVLHFSDGTTEAVQTDSSWLSRRDNAYNDYQSFDSTLENNEFEPAVELEDRWNAEPAPIPMLSFHEVSRMAYTLKAGERISDNIDLDRIYGAYPIVKSTGKCTVKLETRELKGQNTETENIKFGGRGRYFSFLMHSVGNTDIVIENNDDKEIVVEYALLASWYPITKTGSFKCSDEELNKVYDVCAHTLKICRQTLHLDSTKHQELLACTGDYYIESLMTLYIYGDLRLSKFDLMRTADFLNQNNGRMFHTTYSLIWAQMIYDVYMMTGDKEVVRYCLDGLNKLFKKFDTYIGDSGVIETPPDFMFVDWTVIDGYSMHHPPKALGQTVLNAFYYEALNKAVKIYETVGDTEKANEFAERAKAFRPAFNREFYDAEKGLYFDGKNDEYGGSENHIPANSDKRYYSKYPNILASLYGLTDDDNARAIIEKVIFNDEMQDIQPYFAHYLLCALKKLGLFEKYGMRIINRWKPVVAECDKGLKEGWIAPQPDYSFDHSHAWGGTVAYQLPSAISGMKILEPGMKKLSFEPKLYGLKFADIEIPTEYGMISIKLKEKEKPVINVPDEIAVE